MVYITGTRDQNAAALKMVIQKVGGRPFSEGHDQLLDPSFEECVYVPAMAMDVVTENREVLDTMARSSVTMRTVKSGQEETSGMANIRVVIRGPEQGRAAVHALMAAKLAAWRATARISAGAAADNVDDLMAYMLSTSAGPGLSMGTGDETSVKMTIPSTMLSLVLGNGDAMSIEIKRQTGATIRILPQASPSVEIDLVIVAIIGSPAQILKAQEILLLRMLTTKSEFLLS
jgi:hypothetical protein